MKLADQLGMDEQRTGLDVALDGFDHPLSVLGVLSLLGSDSHDDSDLREETPDPMKFQKESRLLN
jgi:hypothetical protein